MNAPLTYLDYNATAPVKPAVRAAMMKALDEGGNPSSIHSQGRRARAQLDEARDAVAMLIGACADNVIFTSGGTEANNLAILSLAQVQKANAILVSAIEHPCVREAALATGLEVHELPVTSDGRLDLQGLKTLLGQIEGRVLLCAMLANNETGVIQPVAQAAEYVHESGGIIHCDAVQAVGKIPVSIAELGVDSLALSAHKFGGPQGAGALALFDDFPLPARAFGGGQERGRRGGTENFPGIVGLGKAAELAMAELETFSTLAELRASFEARLSALAPNTVIFGADVPRLPNTSAFAAPGVDAETLLMALDLSGIAVSSGSACSSGKVATSHVLKAMNVPDDLARCALRVSLGWGSNSNDLDSFIAAWQKARACAENAHAHLQQVG